MNFKKLLSVIVITIIMITSSSFKLNSLNKIRTSKDSITVKNKPVMDSTKRQKILKETGINIPNHVPYEHIDMIYDEAKKHEIPLKIFVKLIQRESEFNYKAYNKNTGAKGYTQLMPTTYNRYAKKLKLEKKPINNIKIGAFYLKEMYNYWSKFSYSEEKKWKLALASYNAGINTVMKIKRVPNYRETKKFVDFILE